MYIFSAIKKTTHTHTHSLTHPSMQNNPCGNQGGIPLNHTLKAMLLTTASIDFSSG